MVVDIIIIAYSDRPEFKKMTQECIDSLHESEIDYQFNVIVVETYNKEQVYENATVYPFNRPKFGYHKSINFALQFTTSEYVGFFNNDVIFDKYWFSNLVEGFRHFDSISPNDPQLNLKIKEKFKEGYEIRQEIMGWAIVVTRHLLNKIGNLSEDVRFWRSELAYIQQMQGVGLKHAVASRSNVRHLTSKTLETKSPTEYKELTHKQQLKFGGIKKHYPFISVIMASYLEKYKGAASNREEKFLRAVNYYLSQTYKDSELIIIADGCEKTVKLYKKHFQKYRNIKCVKISKQAYLAGAVRQMGIEIARGDYICYLDSDDFIGKDHLKNIAKNINDYDWVYWDDYWYDGKAATKKNVELKLGSSGTSSICHKRLINASWFGLDGYAHDWEFIQQLIESSENYSKIEGGKYMICHTAHSGLDV